ncbi:hypothetical protein PYCC9005_004041 [Savitreella phatthalungensis]
MPPSTHYLNLLNLNASAGVNQTGLEQFSNEDLQRELDLFTNSQFLEDNNLFDGLDNYGPQSQHAHHPQSQHMSVAGSIAGSEAHVDHASAAVNMPALQPFYGVPHPYAGQHAGQQQQAAANAFQPMYPAVTQHPRESSVDMSAADKGDNQLKREIESVDSPATSTGGKIGRTFEEEDKRRRNTAASARFRVKKKQREQALQESAKQMSDKCSSLEGRIRELELENKWLRSLLKPVDNKQASSVLSTLRTASPSLQAKPQQQQPS